MASSFATQIEEAEGETADLDFKAEFSPSSPRDWCELVKDIVAMANSGGGLIVIGADDDGNPSNCDTNLVLSLDSATIGDKVYKYTNTHLIRCEITAGTRQGVQMAAFCVGPVATPVVFIQAGTYDVGGGKQKAAFAQGSVYFRHGAKSEPGTTEDIRASLERELERIRSSWLDGIAKVVTAPTGAVVSVTSPSDVKLSDDEGATAIKLVKDGDVPTYKLEATESLFPYRLKEAAASVNQLLAGPKISTHDVTCVRKAHKVEQDPAFLYKPKYSSPQYSHAFVMWMVQEFQKDEEFFIKARLAIKKQEIPN